MEDDLVMNRLPLPKYYDGVEWNTELKPTRKCIPKYLHGDLPALKHLYIKEKFKEIGKFNCPKLEYFDKMIKNKKQPSKTGEKKPFASKAKKQVSYNQLKEELQYALIIADSESNVVDSLLQKAKSCQKEQRSKRDISRDKNRRLSLARDTGKYFGNTVDLVFRQRKKQMMEQMKQSQQVDLSLAEERMSAIKLLPLES